MVNQIEQLRLLPENIELNSQLWSGSFNSKESSLHQLAPYVGKLKSGMVRVLIELYSQKGNVVLDPFCGAGVVPLECIINERHAIANDLSPYAYTITRGKLSAPSTQNEALEETQELLSEIESTLDNFPVENVPEWVSQFFHPRTLKEILAAFNILKEKQNYFLMACLLGILHHVRPGFLSYPASHLTPYLRLNKYPPEHFPTMYSYRDLRSRLIAKVIRAYRQTQIVSAQNKLSWRITQDNAMNLSIPSEFVDAIISSPPYFGALDYARDNRLRLWFLGVSDWKDLDHSLTANSHVYIPQMKLCLLEMDRVLKNGGYCVLVLGDVERDGVKKETAKIISELAEQVSGGRLSHEFIYTDEIPDNRRSRRQTRTTKYERILVLRKTKAQGDIRSALARG